MTGRTKCVVNIDRGMSFWGRLTADGAEVGTFAKSRGATDHNSTGPDPVVTLPFGTRSLRVEGVLEFSGRRIPLDRTWTLLDIGRITFPLFEDGAALGGRLSDFLDRLEATRRDHPKFECIPLRRQPDGWEAAFRERIEEWGGPVPEVLRGLAAFAFDRFEDSGVFGIDGRHGLLLDLMEYENVVVDEMLEDAPAATEIYRRSLPVMYEVGDGMQGLGWDPEAGTESPWFYFDTGMYFRPEPVVGHDGRPFTDETTVAVALARFQLRDLSDDLLNAGAFGADQEGLLRFEGDTGSSRLDECGKVVFDSRNPAGRLVLTLLGNGPDAPVTFALG